MPYAFQMAQVQCNKCIYQPIIIYLSIDLSIVHKHLSDLHHLEVAAMQTMAKRPIKTGVMLGSKHCNVQN